MYATLAVASLLVAAPAAAQSLEAAWTSSSFDRLEAPAIRSFPARLAVAERGRGGIPPRRRIGFLQGTLNGSPIHLRWTEMHLRVAGTVNGADVDVRHDAQAREITGTANGGPVRLAVASSPESLSVDGSVAGKTVGYNVDWRARKVTGGAYGKPIELSFQIDGNSWRIHGTAGGSTVELHQAPAESIAKIRGTLQGSEAEVGILHVQLADFFTQLYLLLRP